MPLIREEKKVEYITSKVKINVEVKSEIEEYCKWAKLDDLSYFLNEAAQYVLGKDKDWQLNKKRGKCDEVK